MLPADDREPIRQGRRERAAHHRGADRPAGAAARPGVVRRALVTCRRSRHRAVVAALISVAAASTIPLAGCARSPAAERPSILLVVLDTVRADAVSAYGAVAGTTPYLDELARHGLRYAHAFSPAPWTTPSHVSLFTGLGVEHHRIGMSERITAGPELVMLAERLRDAGYETAAFIENPLVGEPFGMAQGFERFDARSLEQLLSDVRSPRSSGFSVVEAIDAWAAGRHDTRPFFVFVNLFEAHEPYLVRETNRFLPRGVTRSEALHVRQSPSRICDAIPPERELRILRGLYLGDVAEDDATLASVHSRVRDVAGKRPLITIVTADHGEHLGERRLLDHQYTLDDVALHVPLVVSGLPDAVPAVIEPPVTLVDVTASVLSWSGVGAVDGLDGRPLPVTPDAAPPPRDLLVSYADRPLPADWPLSWRPDVEKRRSHCTARDRVFGDIAGLIRYPYELVWYAQYGPELYDLGQERGSRVDLVERDDALARTLLAELTGRIEDSGLFARSPAERVDPRARDALRALGYAE